MRSFCQFILLILLLAQGGCSWLFPHRLDDEAFLSRVEPVWFEMNQGIKLASWQGEVQPHLFFDPLPDLNPALSHVQFLPLSIAGSEFSYELDVVSGQRYFSSFYCEQNDVWKEKRKIPERPLYTLGVIPRHFDQLNQPQRIIVFGGQGRFKIEEPVTYRVRIIGALVEQLCLVGKCSGPKEWVGRMILVGVDEKERKFSGAKKIEDLKNLVDMEQVKGQLENLYGRNRQADVDYPAVKIGNLIPASEAVDFMLKRSIVLVTKELVTLQKSCSIIYQKLWKDVGEKNFLDQPAQTKEEIRKHADLVKKLKLSDKPTYFPQRLAHFLKKYGDDLATCGRLVYPGDPNGQMEKFKFVSWVNMFVQLHKAGWEYDCRMQAWQPSNLGKEAMDNMKKYGINCTERSYDAAMKYLPAFLKTLRAAVGQRWRFVGWDEHTYGTHSKLQTWINTPDRVFACEKDMNEKIREGWKENPEGMEWLPRFNPQLHKNGDYIY
ncbi:MAG: hypothetical protein K2P81_02415 [Bacteriovoracaceae bacterium]|nr:hypothetical protein [Bacteriovoracaceae bacterium]